MKIQLKVLDKEFYKENPLPNYQTGGSAALDLYCTKDITIYPQERVKIPTGLAVWIGSAGRKRVLKHTSNSTMDDPEYYESNDFTHGLGKMAGFIIPRSGLGTDGLVLANTVGLIDEDYQGELMVSAWNSLKSDIEEDFSEADFSMDIGMWEGIEEVEKNIIELKAGDRFAQIYFAPVIKVQWDIVEEFSNKTDRGDGGFGHSGV
jgi:dUTP pyrophosphatase